MQEKIQVRLFLQKLCVLVNSYPEGKTPLWTKISTLINSVFTLPWFIQLELCSPSQFHRPPTPQVRFCGSCYSGPIPLVMPQIPPSQSFFSPLSRWQETQARFCAFPHGVLFFIHLSNASRGAAPATPPPAFTAMMTKLALYQTHQHQLLIDPRFSLMNSSRTRALSQLSFIIIVALLAGQQLLSTELMNQM